MNEQSGRARLRRQTILRGQRRFDLLFRQGVCRRERHFDLMLLAAPAGEPGRVAFAAARRVQGAVQRNRLKRRLREAYRLEHGAVAFSTDMVFIGKPGVLHVAMPQLRTEMRRCLRALEPKTS